MVNLGPRVGGTGSSSSDSDGGDSDGNVVDSVTGAVGDVGESIGDTVDDATDAVTGGDRRRRPDEPDPAPAPDTDYGVGSGGGGMDQNAPEVDAPTRAPVDVSAPEDSTGANQESAAPAPTRDQTVDVGGETVDLGPDETQTGGSGQTSAGMGSIPDRATDGRDGGALDRAGDVVSDAGETVREGASDAVDSGVERAQRGVDTVQAGADDVVRDVTGGEVGVSDDFTSAEDAFGGEGAFGEEGISPSARLSLTDEDAIEARAEKEQEILSWRDVDSPGDVPAATAGALFGAGQQIERGSIAASEGISDAVPSPEIGPQVGKEHLGEVPANMAGGSIAFGGMALGAAAQLPGSAAHDAQEQLDGEATPTQEQGGTVDLAQNFGESQVEMAANYPVSTAAGFALPSASSIPASVRGMRATRGTSGRVRWDEITTEAGARGENPQFDTDTNAPTGRAIDELEGRMADQPETVRQEADGGVLFHTTDQPFGGGRFEVGEGASEYPGLFASPEASPLGLRTRGVGRPSDGGETTFGLGDYSLQPEAAPAFRPRDLEGIPGDAAEPGYAVRGGDGEVIETGLGRAEANRIADEVDGDRVPDPTTEGYEFMTEQAPTETGMVRPPGDRTPEMEAVFAPDSEFQRAGAVGVELPDGRTIRSDIYKPAGEAARGGDTARADADVADAPARTARDISESAGGPSRQPDISAESVFGTTAAAGPTGTTASGGAGETASDPFGVTGDGTRAGTEPTGSTGGTDGATGTTGDSPPGDGGSTGTGGGTPSEPTGPTGGPFEPTSPTTSAPPSVRPESPTTGVPSRSGPPTRSEATPSPSPSEAVPTGGGSDPYGLPFGEPTQTRETQPRPRRRSDDDEDVERQQDAEPLMPASPEFTNPIASGTADLFGEGSGLFGGDSGDAEGGDLGPFG